MFKFCFGVLTAATLTAAIAPASAQQPTTPPAEAASPPAAAAPAAAAAPPAAAAPAASDTGQSAAPAGAFSYFVNLKNGDTVTSPFKVVFGLSPNMGVAPAGVDKENVGHHHILIDTTLTPEQMTQPLPVDAQHVHFGKGQTETTVTLPPGQHTLQLVLANWTHIPFKPPVQSEVITITVKGESAEKPAAAEEKNEEKKEATKEGMKEKQATHRRHVRHYDRSRRYMREHYMHS